MNKKEYNKTENQDLAQETETVGNPSAESGENRVADNMADPVGEMSGEAVENGTQEASRDLTPEEEIAVWKDKFVRLSAEYDNYRKRTFKEKLDLINSGGEDVVRSMLEVLDDMDRALEAIVNTDDLESLKQGIILIDTKLRGALKGRGLAEIEAVGSELDTDLHEAVARIETEDRKLKGKIIDVVQKGYKLKDKIIRYSKVVVGQ